MRSDKGDYTKFEFSTWGKWLEAVKGKSEMPDDDRASRTEPKNKWTGNLTYPESIDMALAGWKEQTKKVAQMSKAIFTKMASKIDRVDIKFDVEGEFVDIGRFLDNEPECMGQFDSKIMAGIGRKHVRIVFNIGENCGTGGDQMIQKGSTAVALIQLLEFAGHSVECVVGCGNSGSGHQLDVYTTVKQAGQTIDLNRLCFALAHPAHFRRMFFSFWETMDKKLRENHSIYRNGGYGRSGQTQERGDIYFPSSAAEMFNTNEKMEKFIMDSLIASGVDIKGQTKKITPKFNGALSGKPVTPENFKIGAKVRRGPNWQYSDQDVDEITGEQTIGEITKKYHWEERGDKWVTVKWGHGNSYNYRVSSPELIFA